MKLGRMLGFSFAGLAVIACACAIAAQQPATADLKIDVQRVVVRVIAREKRSHNTLDNLTADDFRLKSDGELQPLTFFGHGPHSTRPLGIVLLLDTRVLHRENVESLAHTAQAALEKLGVADQVAIWRMDQAHTEELLPPTTDRKEVLDRLVAFSEKVPKTPQFGSGPLIALNAIIDARSQFSPDCDIAIVAITSDLDAENRVRVDALRTALLRHGVTLHLVYRAGKSDRAMRKLSLAVAPGGFAPTVPWLRYQALSYLAKESGGEFVPVEQEDYGAAFLQVIGDIGASYVLEFRRPRTVKRGFHRIVVSLAAASNRPAVHLLYRQGYIDSEN